MIFKCATVVTARKNKIEIQDPCRFHISVSRIDGPGHSPDQWKFNSVCKQHTCRANAPGRLQNVPSRVLLAGSEALRSFVPGNRKSHGNTKQVQAMALRSGIDMKKSQAHGIVTSHAKHTIEYHLASYWFLKPIIDSLKTEDPQGTYILETKNINDKEVFERFYAVSYTHLTLPTKRIV